MWQRFSDETRKAVFFAEEEAEELGVKYVDTEHLLLGILRETDSDGTRLLESLGLNCDDVRKNLRPLLNTGKLPKGADRQLTKSAKHAIDLTYDEARSMGHGYIGTAHLLLGLLKEQESMAGKVLRGSGIELEKTREVVRSMADGGKFSGRVADGDATAMRSTTTLRGRSITGILDLTQSEIELILSTASFLKETWHRDRAAHLSMLNGKTLAMIFEKPSLRTRVTFEAGMTQLGGHAIYLGPNDIALGKRESVPDAAKNLSRWVDVIMARVFSHDTIVGLAENASVPVINGLCDLEHPCQALADFQTIHEKKGELAGLKLVFIGDGNNVANSLMLLASKVGTHFTLACPEGYEPPTKIVKAAREFAKDTGSQIEIVRDPNEAVKDADALYTDVWASMGQEAEKEERKKVFASYQINQALLAKAKPDAIVLHCLPAHRGEEITDEVLDGPQSVVLDEAENRLHAQKALITLVV